VTLPNQAIDALQVVAGKSKMVEIHNVGRLRTIEQSQHYSLAEVGRNRRHAQIDVAARDAQPDSTVLRQPLLRDIEPRHDFDARGDRGLKALGRRQHVVKHPIDAEAHHQFFFENFDVDITRAILDRLRQDTVDEFDYRRRVVRLEQVQRLRRELTRDHVETLFLEIDHQIFSRRRRGLVVCAIDRFRDYFGGRDQRVDLRAVEDSQIVERFVIGRIGNRNRHDAVDARERQQPILLRVVDWNLGNEDRVERVLVDMRLKRHPIFLRERTRKALRLERAHLDQHVGQFLAGLLALARFVEVLRRDP